MSPFWNWWQHLPEHINPEIFQIGSFRLRYYSLLYLVAFTITYLLALHRIKKEPRWNLSHEHLQGLIITIIIGLIISARIGYVIFYNFTYYAAHPLEIILPFRFGDGIHFTGISGMSYHGGLIGTVVGGLWYCRKNHLPFKNAVDLLIPCIPIAYAFGRLGNFINGELWGRVTTVPWGMYFPFAGPELRHPSQLYELFGEGILLFAVLWPLRKNVRTPGAMLALYLIGYGMVRFVIEYFRQPDEQFRQAGEQLGYVFLQFSMGQMLCSAMIATGILLYILFKRLKSKPA